MKVVFILVVVAIASLNVNANHLIVGDMSGAELVSNEEVTYNAIPFQEREKFYFFTQPDNRKIKGIQAIDNLHSKASMTITSGGVGYSFVNVLMKSERGSGLNYNIGIYVEPYSYNRYQK